MTSFVNALRSEWTKMASLRSTWIFVILLVGSMFGPVVLMSTLAETGTTLDWKMLTIGSMIFAMIGIAYAGSALAGEYNDQMQAHAFLTQDRRSLWLVARGLLQMVLLFVAWGVGVGIAFLVTLVAPNIAFEGGSGQDAVSSVLTFAVFSVIAMALGVLTRSRVAAVAIPLVWLLVVEKLIELATIVSKVAVPFWLARRWRASISWRGS
nr:ABC transporter permease [Corynebacterium lactis]